MEREVVSCSLSSWSVVHLLLDFIKVPLVVIFTKMDALDDEAFNELIGEIDSETEAEKLVPSRAEAIFKKRLLNPLEEAARKPMHIVKLRRTHSLPVIMVLCSFTQT